MPYDKILELVEAKQLDIATVSLAKITGNFIKYVQELEQSPEKHIYPKTLADFVSVAAKLLLIKSKILLPSFELTEDEETDVRELEERLKVYRLFKSAAHNIDRLYYQADCSYSRPYLAFNQAIFRAPGKSAIAKMAAAIQSLTLSKQETLNPKTETVKFKLISINDKIKEVLKRLAGSGRRLFSQLAGKNSREERVAAFLAILQLLKDKVIQAEQDKSFSDIKIWIIR